MGKEIAIEEMPVGSITAHFAIVEDPRKERSKKHKLLDIITIVESYAARIAGWT